MKIQNCVTLSLLLFGIPFLLHAQKTPAVKSKPSTPPVIPAKIPVQQHGINLNQFQMELSPVAVFPLAWLRYSSHWGWGIHYDLSYKVRPTFRTGIQTGLITLNPVKQENKSAHYIPVLFKGEFQPKGVPLYFRAAVGIAKYFGTTGNGSFFSSRSFMFTKPCLSAGLGYRKGKAVSGLLALNWSKQVMMVQAMVSFTILNTGYEK